MYDVVEVHLLTRPPFLLDLRSVEDCVVGSFDRSVWCVVVGCLPSLSFVVSKKLFIVYTYSNSFLHLRCRGFGRRVNTETYRRRRSISFDPILAGKHGVKLSI